MLLRRISCAAFVSVAVTIPATAQETTRVSVDSAGVEGDLQCSMYDAPALSADGRFVAFVSKADNLVANDTNSVLDVFVHDRVTGTTERVSVDSAGAEANGESRQPTISADGQLVAFASNASNLVAADTNGKFDVFVHDRATGVTERVSVKSNGHQANGLSLNASISADGHFVAFASGATNLVAGDTNGKYDVFVHDRVTGVTERVSVDSSSAEAHGDSGNFSLAVLSADGQIVAFDSDAPDLITGDTNRLNDVFVHDRATGLTERVSVSSSGVQGNALSTAPSLSADGQVVAFFSGAGTLVAQDTNHTDDVFVHDRGTGTTERVSVNSLGGQANDWSIAPTISADGQIVAFYSFATNLVLGDTNFLADDFVHDRVTGMTERVSVDSGGAEGDGDSWFAAISADGLVVAFDSDATNLVANDTNGVADVFVHEFCSSPAAWSNYGAGFPGTNGVPAFTSQQNPVLGSTITLDLGNSYANPTVGLMFIGFQRASIHSGRGGDLLVVPTVTQFIAISSGGDSFTGAIPADRDLCSVTVDLQAIEADPGAAMGVSFTAGLELLLGN